MARFTGLSEDYLVGRIYANLFQFMKELQRSRGLTTGRLDARFSGPTYDLLGEFAEYDPQETAISGHLLPRSVTAGRSEIWRG
jgi:hypothetical protein